MAGPRFITNRQVVSPVRPLQAERNGNSETADRFFADASPGDRQTAPAVLQERDVDRTAPAIQISDEFNKTSHCRFASVTFGAVVTGCSSIHRAGPAQVQCVVGSSALWTVMTSGR